VQNLYGELTGAYADGRGKYLTWAERCEVQLRHIFTDDAVVQGVYTDRYWRIAEAAVLDRQPQIISSEIRVQVERLSALGDWLHSQLRLGERPGAIVVVDTNVLLHHQRVDRILWSEVTGQRQVRLVIPLLVLEELDNRRYLGSADLKRKSRSAVEPLDHLQETFDREGYATLPDGTTIEYLADDPNHRRDPNPDEEILDRAEFLHQVTKRPVLVMTGDRAMRVRIVARGSGLRAQLMPAKYARDQEAAKEAGGPPG
jgi:rRNA-processing protein FCF1